MRNVARLVPAANPEVTMGDLVQRHVREVSQSRIIGISQMYTMKRLAASTIGGVLTRDFRAQHVVDFANDRKSGAANEDGVGVCPATINQDMTYLSGVVQMVKLWKVDGWERVIAEFDEAKLWLVKLNLVGKSRPRSRRPAEDEIERIKARYREQQAGYPDAIPMITLIDFAIASCRRQAEITRIKWENLDYDRKLYMVEDVKDPKVKKGNNIWFPALGDAWSIMLAQPMVSEYVFPYNPKSVGASFTREKKALGIINLRFHDLRREGATRLLEMGYSSSEVRLVTGHKTTNILDRVYLAPDPALLHLGPASMRDRPRIAAPQ